MEILKKKRAHEEAFSICCEFYRRASKRKRREFFCSASLIVSNMIFWLGLFLWRDLMSATEYYIAFFFFMLFAFLSLRNSLRWKKKMMKTDTCISMIDERLKEFGLSYSLRSFLRKGIVDSTTDGLIDQYMSGKDIEILNEISLGDVLQGIPNM